MSRHTPGPWRIVGEDDLPKHDDLMVVAFDVTAPGEDPPELYVCNIGSDGGRYGAISPVEAGERWPVSLANARLIAAAPDLLAACKLAACRLEDVPFQEEIVKILDEAIAKAEDR